MKDVGSHLFCPPCFDNLLAPKPSHVATNPEGHLQVEAAPDVEQCLLCEAPMPAGPSTTIGNLGLCETCHSGLTLAPPTEPEAAPSVETQPAQETPEGPNYTPGSATCHCAGCGRPLPGPGSFKEVDGKPFCPECVYGGRAHATPELSVSVQQVMPASAVSPQPKDQPGECCDACLRPLVRGHFDCLAGFWICRACSTSHEALAVGIARVRHAKHLEEVALKLRAEADT